MHRKNKLTRSEWKWLVVFTIIIIVLTTTPYFIGFMNSGIDWTFSGFVFGVEDGNSYIAKMFRGSAGEWLFRSPYTAYDQKGFIAFLPYTLLGKLTGGKSIHEQLIALFHIYRIIASFFMIFASYSFFAVIFKRISYRRIGTILTIAGGGMGWLSIFIFNSVFKGRLPLEFYSPESFGFLSIYGLPHLAMARALLLFGFRYYLDENLYYIQAGIYTGILWLLLGFFQPLYIVICWIVIVVSLVFTSLRIIFIDKLKKFTEIIDTEQIKKIFICILISSPFVIYTIISFSFDPYLIGWSEQNIIKSPPMFDYVFSYGIFIILIVFNIRSLIHQFTEKYLVLFSWFLIFPLLVYSPYNLQRRLSEGWWVVLVTLMLLSISLMRKRKIIITVISLLSIMNFIIIIYGGILSVITPGTPLFRSSNEIKTIKYLKEIVEPDDVILTNYDLSNVIPAWMPVFTLIGHGPESINLDEVQIKVDNYFDDNYIRSDKYDLINEFNVDYIIYSPEEVSFGTSNNPIYEYEMVTVYQDEGYKIIEVIH